MMDKPQQLFDYFALAMMHVGMRYFIVAGSAFILLYVLFRKAMNNRKIQSKFPQITDYGRDFSIP